jgi:tetratricopeptide (TPR) repeat protein
MAHAAGEGQVEQVERRALLDLGRLWASRDYNQARDCFERALELARRMDDPAVLADSLNWMGNWHTNDDKPLRAVQYHREALQIVEELGDWRELANTLDLLGAATVAGGDLDTGVQCLNRAIELYRELDDRPRLVSSLLTRLTAASIVVVLASVSPILPRDPTLDFHEALRIAREIDSASDEAWAFWSLGQLHTVHGHFGRALEEIPSGLFIASQIGHRQFVVTSRQALGILYVELFAPDQAQGQLEGALTMAGELHSSLVIHLVTGALAGAYYLRGDLTLAQSCLETVISPQTPMDTLGKRYCWARRAELALAQDDPALALDITERLIASAPGMSPGRVITFLWKLKGEACAAMGRTDQAESLLRAALENARAVGERFLLWRVHASLGRLYRAMDRKREAEEAFSAARELVQELAATIPDEALKDNFLQGALSTLGTPP